MTAHDAFVGLAAVGGLLLVLGILSGLIHEKGILSEPLFALVAGVLIGPAAFGLMDLAHFGDPRKVLEYASLLTLAVALVGVALRLPEWYSLRNGRLLIVLLGILMPLMWISCALLLATGLLLAVALSGPVATREMIVHALTSLPVSITNLTNTHERPALVCLR